MLAFKILIFVLKNVLRKSRFNEMVERKKIGNGRMEKKLEQKMFRRIFPFNQNWSLSSVYTNKKWNILCLRCTFSNNF